MLREAIFAIDRIGVAEVIFPFLVVFTIIYGALNRIETLGKKSMDIVIAASMALLVIFPHFTGIGPDYVPLLNGMGQAVTILIIMVLAFLIIITLVGVKVDKKFFTNVVAFLLIFDILIPDALLLAFLARNFNITIPDWLDFLRADWFLEAALIFSIVGAIMFFITRD